MGTVSAWCKICGGSMHVIFKAEALIRYQFEMLSCADCGLLQIANPHWLAEAYSDAIADTDTGLVVRNLSLASRLQPLLYYLFGASGRYVDMSGGTGLFVRLMRDAGYDYYWQDPYCRNVHARGFEFVEAQTYRAVSAFEVLEHVVDPLHFLSDALTRTGANCLFFTTEVFCPPPKKPDDWWYYGFDAGQHISFFQERTLGTISAKLGLRFLSFGGMHIFCDNSLFAQLSRYHSSRLLRYLARRRFSRIVKSKTMDDRRYLVDLNRRKDPP